MGGVLLTGALEDDLVIEQPSTQLKDVCELWSHNQTDDSPQLDSMTEYFGVSLSGVENFAEFSDGLRNRPAPFEEVVQTVQYFLVTDSGQKVAVSGRCSPKGPSEGAHGW